jgi:BASS family bile acid:Na+ symporter
MMLAINASMFLVVFVLGLGATFEGITYLLRRPGLLLRSILSMNVIMFAFAVGVCVVFDPPAAIKIALIGIAISPVPPFLPTQQLNAGGMARYVYGLIVGTALASIVVVPLAIELIDHSLGLNVRVPVTKVAIVVSVTVLIPLVLGVIVHRFAPTLAERIARPLAVIGNLVLVAAAIPLFIAAAPMLWPLIGNGVLAALIGFTAIGVAVGHFLGGPIEDNRSVLALATGSRHPGIALAIVSVNFPARTDVIAVVLYHLVIGALVALPYVIWRKRARKRERAS